MCVGVCLWLGGSMCLCMSVSVGVGLCRSVSLSVCVCLYVWVCVSHSVWLESVCTRVGKVCECVSVCDSVCMWASVGGWVT